ncbi:hypothetical protein ACTFIY_009683 [Dictyostelium cf. discoideum]
MLFLMLFLSYFKGNLKCHYKENKNTLKINFKANFKANFKGIRAFTAFSFKGKLYQFRRAPFSMKNSPAYFNKWIQSIIEEFKEREKVYLAANKAELFKEGINNLPEPTTFTELRSFLGSCNYLRTFIPNYSELTARLAALTGTKNTRVSITEEMRDDIKRLKQAITSPWLAKPYFSKSFDVYIDASDIVTGCFIMQDDGNIRPIFYYSCRFSKYQKNYSTTDI